MTVFMLALPLCRRLSIVYCFKVEALATEISSTKDQLRRCVASKTEVEAELGQSKEALEAAETRAARFEV
jgi:hypothetical protein